MVQPLLDAGLALDQIRALVLRLGRGRTGLKGVPGEWQLYQVEEG